MPQLLGLNVGSATEEQGESGNQPSIPFMGRSESSPVELDENRPSRTAKSDRRNHSSREINQLIEEFENRWEPSSIFLSRFVREAGLEHCPSIVCELVRVDLDLRYSASVPVYIDWYLETFPALVADPAAVGAIAYEDFRSRMSRGLPVSRERWEHLPSVANLTWFQRLDIASRPRCDEEQGDWLIRPPRSTVESTFPKTPKVGHAFGDFFLLKLLGRGAFSEVFLARQDSLANRYVAVKIVKRTLNEPASLARLQHAGIVPLYSLHRVADYSILCMPYAGSATLADWLHRRFDESLRRHGQAFVETLETSARTITIADLTAGSQLDQTARAARNELEQLLQSIASPYIENLRSLDNRQFTIWLAHRLASAISHAHLRGIIHGDLKPANILIRNDGEPALIDFNLAQSQDLVEPTVIGGTLPYMAPEQLRALLSRQASFTPASDVFSLGVILYQVIEGKLPFPSSASTSECDLLCALSSMSSTRIVWTNRDVSPGLKAIVEKCLSIHAGERYGDGTSVLQDLEHERLNLPLRFAPEPIASRYQKLTRRYPRLFSSSAMGLVAMIALSVVGSFAYGYWNRANITAAQAKQRAIDDLGYAIVDRITNFDETHSKPSELDAIERLRRELFDFHGPQPEQAQFLDWLPSDEQSDARNALYSLNLVFAYGLHEKLKAAKVNSIHRKRMETLIEESIRCCRAFSDLSSRHSLLGFADSKEDQRSFREFLAFEKDEIDDPVDAMVLARLALANRLNHHAIHTIKAMPTKSPYQYWYWLTIGESQLRLRRFDEAKFTLSQATAFAPQNFRAWQLQAEADASAGKLDLAITNYSKAIALAPFRSDLYADRARVYEQSRNVESALSDVDRALALSPNSNRLLLFRSRLNNSLGRRKLADEDLELALKQTPTTESDWISRALARAKSDPRSGMKDLENALALNPSSLIALQNKAHIESEYLHDFDAAIETLSTILKIDPDFEPARAGRAVLYGRSQDLDAALKDIQWFENANQASLLASTLYQFACAYSLISDGSESYQSEALKHLTKSVQRGYGIDLLRSDPDLDLMRSVEKFKQLEELAAIIEEAGK